MRNYEERAKDFIAQIFPFIADKYDPYTIADIVAEFNHQFNRHVEMKHGIARIALITSDYVVKFDFDDDEVDSVGGCENEIAVYAEAERDGFAYLFAKTTRYEYKNRFFYIMPRINGVGSKLYHYAEDYLDPKEQEWCDAHNISDLHCNNYGFRNGHICLIDYACNLEETSYSEY